MKSRNPVDVAVLCILKAMLIHIFIQSKSFISHLRIIINALQHSVFERYVWFSRWLVSVGLLGLLLRLPHCV